MACNKEYDEKIVTELKKILRHKEYICDCCNKKLSEFFYDDLGKETKSTRHVERFYEYRTHHNDWPESFEDSYTEGCVCEECLASGKLTKLYLDLINEDNIMTQGLSIEENYCATTGTL